MSSTLRIASGSVVVGFAVLGLKYLAFHVTGSVALYSDALESIINVVASIAALIALWIAAQPADEGHPFGHSKAEYFSAVLEGALIVVAAFAILREAYAGFQHPRVLDAPALGLAINGAAGVLNGVWAWVLVRAGRARRSAALEADGKHLFTDVATSAGVLVGVALAAITGWYVLDPLMAALVGLNIIYTGWGLVRESVGGLMDAAPSRKVRQQVERVLAAELAGEPGAAVNGLRLRRAGHVTFIEFQLLVGGELSVQSAHGLCDRLESALGAAVAGSVTSIHVEPVGTPPAARPASTGR